MRAIFLATVFYCMWSFSEGLLDSSDAKKGEGALGSGILVAVSNSSCFRGMWGHYVTFTLCSAVQCSMGSDLAMPHALDMCTPQPTDSLEPRGPNFSDLVKLLPCNPQHS